MFIILWIPSIANITINMLSQKWAAKKVRDEKALNSCLMGEILTDFIVFKVTGFFLMVQLERSLILMKK